MPYPQSTKTLEALLQLADSYAERVKSHVSQVRQNSSAGSVERAKVIKLADLLNEAIAAWDQAAARGADLAAYALAQKGVQVAPEFAAMRAATVALRDWVVALSTASGNYSDVVNVTSADMAQFRTLATALEATIS